MTFEEKAVIVINQLRADRDRLMDAIEKIRAEIATIRDSWEKDCYHDEAAALTLALQIIDKYAEQEPEAMPKEIVEHYRKLAEHYDKRNV